MISSKDILDKTGISRATLNNYISMGLLERPKVLSATRGDANTPRLGFFPDEALDVIFRVQSLKAAGCSMADIRDKIAQEEHASAEFAPQDLTNPEEPATAISPTAASESSTPSKEVAAFEQEHPSALSVDIGVDSLPGPAYMVNNDFELTWWNQEAESTFFELIDVVDRDITARNIFHLLLNRAQAKNLVNFPQLLQITMSAAKKRMAQRSIAQVYPQLEAEDVALMGELFAKIEAIGNEDISHFIFDADPSGETDKTFTLYVCFFQEGVFFSFLPTEVDSTPLLNLLAQRSRVIQDIMKKRRPFLTNLVTMVADVQSSMQICSELPAEEYFELINAIWQGAEPIFRRYKATHGKHVGDGMVYYFLPQPDSDYIVNSICCSYELRELMREMTKEWQARKNWGHELFLNIGLNEGQEWFGTYHAGTHLEFTVLGDTINHAARLSDFARQGAIWATKTMLSKMKRETRSDLRYGIYRENLSGERLLAPEFFARVSSLIDLSEGKNYKFLDIGALPVAEIVDVNLVSIGAYR